VKLKIMPLLLLIVVLALQVPVFAAEHWSDIPMKYMTENGYYDAAVNPNEEITRIELARVLAKLPLIDKGSNYIFTDTSDKDVIKVAKSSLMCGRGNQLFAANEKITREEVAKVFACLLPTGQSNEDIPFADKDSVSEWARPYLSALAKEKIVLGYEDNTFRPQTNISYAEVAVMFMKVRDAYSVNSIIGNVFNNAPLSPIQYLKIPDGSVGVLSIPSLGINNLSVVEDGENLDNIKVLPGHFINTALFDGNVCICGHNFTDKSPWFGKLSNIQEGASITWKTKFGIRQYKVTTKQNIAADDWSFLMDTAENRMTIITCLAGQAQTHRILVQAVSSD